MFVWRDFREDEIFKREKWKERNFNGCLVGRGSGKKMCWGLGVLSSPNKKCSLQNREKTKGRSTLTWVAQNALAHSSLLIFFVSSLLLLYGLCTFTLFWIFCFISLFFFFLLFLSLSSIVPFFFFFFYTSFWIWLVPFKK